MRNTNKELQGAASRYAPCGECPANRARVRVRSAREGWPPAQRPERVGTWGWGETNGIPSKRAASVPQGQSSLKGDIKRTGGGEAKTQLVFFFFIFDKRKPGFPVLSQLLGGKISAIFL